MTSLATAKSRSEKARERAHKWYLENTERANESNRRWREENPERKREIDREWRLKNPKRVQDNIQRWRVRNREKVRAWDTAEHAVHTGKITRQPCEVCGSDAEMHHPDYAFPLEVKWLCRKHHKELHRIADLEE